MGKFVHCNEQKVWKIGHRNEQNNGKLFVTTERDAQIYGIIWFNSGPERGNFYHFWFTKQTTQNNRLGKVVESDHLNMYRFGTYFLYTYHLSKIALCNEQNLPKSVHRNAQIYGIIWWILPKIGKKYGGYWRKFGGYT